jgi:quercetin dioxygenase-like cupin family protein
VAGPGTPGYHPGVRVERWDEERDGPVSERALRGRLEALGYRVDRYVYPPGTFFGEHLHPADKVDAVVAGHFEIRMGGERIELGPGDVVFVPTGVLHSATVIGDESVVSLDGVRAD